jgi:predicted XRE-type DNA-binding protein
MMSKATAGKKPKTYGSVWETLADTPEQAANLRTRAELKQIAAIVKESGVSRFSLDAL